MRVALLDGVFTAERCRDWCYLDGMPHRVVERLPDQRSFVVPETRWAVERTFGALIHWGGLKRSRAGRLDVACARLACIVTLSGEEALGNSKQVLSPRKKAL